MILERRRAIRALTILLGALLGALSCLALVSTSAVAAPLEQPVAKPPTGVTGNSAMLQGELNPGGAGEPGEYQFLYKVSDTACRPEAEFIPKPPASSLGNAKETIEIEASNLEPGQTYAFCIVAMHEGEEAQSASVTFKTLPVSAPLVVKGTTAASGVGPFAATLEAQVNPEKEETSYSFEYATNEALTGAKTVPGPSTLPAEFGLFTASVTTGNVLAAETTYYYRVVATNATGTTHGPVEQFTTLTAEKPAVLSESIAALNSNEPKLEAKLNPNFQETSYHFEYSTNATGEILEAPITVVDGAPPAALLPAVSEELEAGPDGLHGLLPGPTYFYRVVATNSTGTTEGPVQSFQALATPAVSSLTAQEVTRATASVSGIITPQGLASTYHFAYVPQAGYEAALREGAANPYAAGHSTHETRLTGPEGENLLDYSPHPISVTLEELVPGTTYDYALVATNELGSRTTSNATFTTATPTAPSVVTGGAAGVSELSAMIFGSVDTHGLQSTSRFEFGTAPYGGAALPATVTAISGTIEAIMAAFNGNLLPGTTYYYRALATNQDGTGEGALQSFTTANFPAAISIPPTPSAIPYKTIAELNKQEAKETPKPTKPLTRAQKLTKALSACTKKPKKQRAACHTNAEHQYGPVKKANTKHK